MTGISEDEDYIRFPLAIWREIDWRPWIMYFSLLVPA
jgi:hypothetical protein